MDNGSGPDDVAALAQRLAATERERDELIEHQRQISALSGELSCAVGFDGAVRALSAAWERTLGRPRAELSAQTFLDLVHVEDRDATTAHTSRLRDGADTVSFENRVQHGDGSWRTLAWTMGIARERATVYAVARDVTAQRRTASQDPLTGLPNQATLLDRLEDALDRGWRSGSRVAVLHLDLDAFQAVNDRRGAAVGDTVLCEVARRLERTLRPGDLVTRAGSDDFVILLENAPDAKAAVRVAQRLVEQFDAPFVVEGSEPLRLTASLGIVLSGDGHHHPLELLRDADAALDRAKAQSRGTWMLFAP